MATKEGDWRKRSFLKSLLWDAPVEATTVKGDSPIDIAGKFLARKKIAYQRGRGDTYDEIRKKLIERRKKQKESK